MRPPDGKARLLAEGHRTLRASMKPYRMPDGTTYKDHHAAQGRSERDSAVFKMDVLYGIRFLRPELPPPCAYVETTAPTTGAPITVWQWAVWTVTRARRRL